MYDSVCRILIILWATLLITLVLPADGWTQVAVDEWAIQNKAQVSDALVPDHGDICSLEPGDYDPATQHVLPPFDVRDKQATANIEVDFGPGFPADGEQAFLRAVEIWERYLETDVTIRIEANYESLDEGVLAQAGPTGIFRCNVLVEAVDGIDELECEGATVGAALGSALTGVDLTEPTELENHLVTTFNSDIDWFFGDPPPAGPGPSPNESDFVSVALHEIGHGLDFFGSMTVSEQTGEGSWGFVTDDDNNPVPHVYDEFPQEGMDGPQLINEIVFRNPSMELAGALTSDDVFFDGPEANEGALAGEGPVPPKLFLPTQDFFPGSSYSHLDQATYPDESINALMRPALPQGQAIQTPGPIMCGMLTDMGWEAGPSCEALLGEEPIVRFEAESARPRQAGFSWIQTARTEIERYILEATRFDEPLVVQEEIEGRGPGVYEFDLDDLEAGDYTFELSFVRADDGERVPFQTADVTVPLEEDVIISELYPNPFRDRLNIQLGVREAQRIRVEAYNALGQKVDVLFDQERRANDPRPVVFDPDNYGTLSSGRYFFRIIGEGFEETRSATLVR